MTIHKPTTTRRVSAPRRGATRRRLTYANVVSTLALFLAVGGDGYAAAAWTGTDIIDGTLTGADVQDNTLYQADLGTDSVAFDELAFNSVSNAHIRDGAVGPGDIAPDAVHQNHIRDGQVLSAEVANFSLRSEDVASTFTAPTATNASKLGGLASGAYEQRVRRAKVTTDYTGAPFVAAGASDGLVSVTRSGRGWYSVRFDTNVAKCTPVATVSNPTADPIGIWQPPDDPNVVNVMINGGHVSDGAQLQFYVIVVC